MEKDEEVAPFFTKIAQVRDQLSAIGVPVDDDDLVQTVFYGLPSSWETFLAIVSGRETQPNFDRLWHDCLEEEGRIHNRTMVLRKGTLLLQPRQGSSRSPSLRRRKKRSHKVSNQKLQI